MLIHLLDACTADERARIEATLGQARADKDPAEVRWMRAAMDRYGSLDYGREVANGIAGAAVEEFHKAFEGARPSRDLAFLEGLATWVFERG
jgi:geranylgeranyl diphosphate synthase type II